MADKQINQLTDGGAVVGTDNFPSQTVGNVTARHSASQIKTFCNSLDTPVLGQTTTQGALNALAVLSVSPIPKTTIDLAYLPQMIATTIPEDANIQYLYVEISDVVNVDATAIWIGIETDQEDFMIIEPDGEGNFNDGIYPYYNTSERTLSENKNILVQAIGGEFSAGTILIKGQVIN